MPGPRLVPLLACTLLLGCAHAPEGAAPADGRQLVRAGMASIRGDVVRCFRSHVRPAHRGGELEVRFVVGSNGKARAVSFLTGHRFDEALETCVTDALDEAEFWADDDARAARITYVYRLAPGATEPSESFGRGEFDDALVTAAVASKRREVRRCYERFVRAYPGLAGKVDLWFRVHPDGSFHDVRVVGNTTGSQALGTCVVQVIERARARQGPTRTRPFSYPFVFQPQG